MYPRTCDRARGTLRRSVEKQSSLPASRRTLAKRSRRSVRNIGPSTSLVNRENRLIHAPDTIIAARVADLPDTHDAHFITPRFSEDDGFPTKSHTAHSRWCSAAGLTPRRLQFTSWAAKGLRQKHTACDQAMITRPTSVPGRTRFAFSTPRGHLRPDKVGRERPPFEWAGALFGGGEAGVPHPPRHPHLASARLRGGEERRLGHQHRASRSRGSSMTCHATPALESFAACVCIGASRSVDSGDHCSRVCGPPPAPLLSAPGGAAVVLFRWAAKPVRGAVAAMRG
jgi:hypothetical protein